jgi:hypothetical protein
VLRTPGAETTMIAAPVRLSSRASGELLQGNSSSRDVPQLAGVLVGSRTSRINGDFWVSSWLITYFRRELPHPVPLGEIGKPRSIVVDRTLWFGQQHFLDLLRHREVQARHQRDVSSRERPATRGLVRFSWPMLDCVLPR